MSAIHVDGDSYRTHRSKHFQQEIIGATCLLLRGDFEGVCYLSMGSRIPKNVTKLGDKLPACPVSVGSPQRDVTWRIEMYFIGGHENKITASSAAINDFCICDFSDRGGEIPCVLHRACYRFVDE